MAQKTQDLAGTSARINVNVNVRLDAANLSKVLYAYSLEPSSNTTGTADGPPGSVKHSQFTDPVG